MKRTFTITINEKAVRMPLFHVDEDKSMDDFGCPCCKRSITKLKSTMDITQLGFEYDKVTTVFYCRKCKKYMALSYKLWAHWTKAADADECILAAPF